MHFLSNTAAARLPAQQPKNQSGFAARVVTEYKAFIYYVAYLDKNFISAPTNNVPSSGRFMH